MTMTHLFGTYAGMYDNWRYDEDGHTYEGARRNTAYQAAESSDGHWVVEPDVAMAAVADAQREFGIEGYDTRWAVVGSQILYATPATEGWQPLSRDEQGRYRLPQLEFPDVADQVRRGIVDEVLGLDGLIEPGFDDSLAAPAESWSPAPVQGVRHEQRAIPTNLAANAGDRARGHAH